MIWSGVDVFFGILNHANVRIRLGPLIYVFVGPEMHRWHAQFESMAPAEHRQFLQFLNIVPKEIGRIREWSRKNARPESAS